MPKWLPQFLMPLWLVLFVVLTVTLGILGAAVILALLLVGLAAWRLRYLNHHPPDPQLVHKPFWRL